jgi:hypothetical protein
LRFSQVGSIDVFITAIWAIASGITHKESFVQIGGLIALKISASREAEIFSFAFGV